MPRLNLHLSTLSAGFVAVLVGFASSVAIVFQAAQAAGASEAMTISWIMALGIGMGLTCIGFSWYYKAPVITAWSTPGAALLATSLIGVPIQQAIGAFLFSSVLILAVGLTGTFDKLIRRIPLSLASAMLAGILVQFGLAVFTSLQVQPALVGSMLIAFILGKRWLPRYAILLVLATGFLMAWQGQLIRFEHLELHLSRPVWVWPEFNLGVVLGVGLPLFIVTMTSQNIPGIATLRASGYERVPVSPLISGTGLASLLLAPLGGFALNLAAITAAICTGPEAHPDADKRYQAGIWAGIFYLLTGIGAATVVTLFSAFPQALIFSLAGLALFGTIANSLSVATMQADEREAAIITFLVTASGLSFLGVGAAFWGLLSGMLCLLIFRRAP
ncbi:benzoate/H(+) symporter BenE family transporter [Bowmanella dokdonensis]|uniref:Benzoate/H(+) symporter BenE family transporter n=1 Tax=Bowmanella dokdonensis TaxID=751969 RepID=A0A939DNV4_9ALTE|nr:benzoate/H(+) symporter BenE family transporter [Bowmanella dokdonensis]MBN7826218.1 benzoate/H(+) symporter BenE family transporter [Bowmanella dokdonensis]